MQEKAFNVILIDSVYRKDKNYYLKVFLEKYNSNDSYNVHSDYSDGSYEKSPMKKIRMKKMKFIDFIFK